MPRDEVDEDTERDFAGVNRMADRLKLKGRDRERYVDEHMTGLGYGRKTTYVRKSDDDDDNGGGRRRYGVRRSRDDGDDDL